MPRFLTPNKSIAKLLSLLVRSQARLDSTYRANEPATVRPPRAPWGYHRYPLCLNLQQIHLMPEFATVTRTYVGEPGTIAVDGYLGFVLGERYELGYRLHSDNSVVLRLTHPPHNQGITLLYVTPTQYRRWWTP